MTSGVACSIHAGGSTTQRIHLDCDHANRVHPCVGSDHRTAGVRARVEREGAGDRTYLFLRRALLHGGGVCAAHDSNRLMSRRRRSLEQIERRAAKHAARYGKAWRAAETIRALRTPAPGNGWIDLMRELGVSWRLHEIADILSGIAPLPTPAHSAAPVQDQPTAAQAPATAGSASATADARPV